ncbi:hypothetical protein GQ43DRAFT_399845, partial [Delitschia confertaspora ATCC 74209]
MFNLPVELQFQCLQPLDIETLKSFRLVNKALSTLATEILFRTVSLLPTDTSAEKYTKILENERLKPLVRRIIFNTSENPDETETGACNPSELLESFASAIGAITRFPNLREVELKFARECAAGDDLWEKEVEETIEFRTEVLDMLCSALQHVEYASALTIKNLQDATADSVYASAEFQRVRDRLRKLHLQIATENEDAAPENSIEKPACHKAFEEDLPRQWFTPPLQAQLTHLTIYGTECLWGVWPFVDLRRVPTFRSLKSLSLGNFTIVHKWQLDWIVSHSDTLEELLLDDCPIIMSLYMSEEQTRSNFPELIGKPIRRNGNYTSYLTHIDLRWYSVFSRFQTGLKNLTRFAIGQGDWDEQRAFEERYELANRLLEDRYLIFDNGTGPSQWARG